MVGIKTTYVRTYSKFKTLAYTCGKCSNQAHCYTFANSDVLRTPSVISNFCCIDNVFLRTLIRIIILILSYINKFFFGHLYAYSFIFKDLKILFLRHNPLKS